MSNRPLTKTEWLTSLEELWEAAQQPRKWVGLTDDEIEMIEAGIGYMGRSVTAIIKEAEAKLKERNT